jgi:hypothetical protein
MIDELEKQQGLRSISILLTRCRFVGGRAMSEGGRPSKSALLAGRQGESVCAGRCSSKEFEF